MSPQEAMQNQNVCPACHKKLTIGVMHRVESLADRPEGFKLEGAPPFKKLLPLSELISAVTGKAVSTQTVWTEYRKLVDGASEFEVLLEMPSEELFRKTGSRIAKAVLDNREQRVRVKPGYDGVYGVPLIEEAREEQATENGAQKTLSQF
jgi:PHP family Zn ribbon phosphoesterase